LSIIVVSFGSLESWLCRLQIAPTMPSAGAQTDQGMPGRLFKVRITVAGPDMQYEDRLTEARLLPTPSREGDDFRNFASGRYDPAEGSTSSA
jgi:hypothetical protein